MSFARPRRAARASRAAASVLARRRPLAGAAVTLALLLAAAACNSDKSTASGPVTLAFTTPVNGTAAAPDTVLARVSIDGAPAIVAPHDSVKGLARGQHTLDVQYDVSYLPQHFTVNVSPSGAIATLDLNPEGSCRDWVTDAELCLEDGLYKNLIFWSQHPRVYCAASDFGDFCTRFPSQLALPNGAGAAWPSDQAGDLYVSAGKLLVAATVGGSKMAMGFYETGDYSPRQRLTPVSGDSSRYLNEVWTDARHLPIYPAKLPHLAPTDRPGQNFGLSVRITYSIPVNQQDVVLARFDIKNISASDSFRYVHPEEPASGHTLTNVYLVPFLDPNIGYASTPDPSQQPEANDDNATVFPQDSLLVAYDQAFSVPNFSTAANGQTRPGLVGLRLVQGPAGTTARALLFTSSNVLSYLTTSAEQATYQLLSGGREAVPAGCTATSDALLCSSESASDVRMGWSVGPVASLAPGQSTSITVALLFASPKTGTFTSGTSVAPQNADLSSTTRAIYSIAESLRTLAASLSGTVVTPAP